MKNIVIFLIIQLFQLSLNQITKELPIYGKIDSINNEKVFLKTNLFRPGKNIVFKLKARVHGFNPLKSPTFNFNYCFTQQKEESCDYIEATNFKMVQRAQDGFYCNYYYKGTIQMNINSNYLLFNLNIENAESLTIEHDPESDITAQEFSQNTWFSKGTTLFFDGTEFVKYQKTKLNLALTTNEDLTNLTIFYDNSNYKNKEFSENLGKSIVTNYFKKTDTLTDFYFSLPVYNYTKESLDYKYLIFRPDNKTGNFKVREIKYDVKGLPKYGKLTLQDKTELDAFYLNIEDFSEGDNIYLQTITSTNNRDYMIYYNFADTYYEEDFLSLELEEQSKNKKSIEENNEYKFYFSIKKKSNKKYLVFKTDADYVPKFTIKNTEKNEYTNKTLIIIIIAVVGVIILGASIGIICYIKKCKKTKSQDVEETESDIPLVE